MPLDGPEPKPPSNGEEYFSAIDHMQDTWTDIAQLRKQLNQKCNDVNKICEQIEDKSLEIDFWRQCADVSQI